MIYSYVGPRAIVDRCGPRPLGTPVASPQDIVRWIGSGEGGLRPASSTTATYVVDAEGALLIADRHSEHVACAGGQPVLAAGELSFHIEGDRVTVTRVSNQSTGYCPEPGCWVEVSAALRRAGLNPPDGFDPRCEFRRCAKCDSINLVKFGVLECGVCEADLPREYNCQG